MPTSNLLLGSHPIEIYTALDQVFGNQKWLSWEPETLLLTVRDQVSEAEEDKLMAVHAVAANGNLVCRDHLAFEKVVNGFCNNICVMDENQPPYVEEICYALPQIAAIIKAVHGRDAKVGFTDEIPGYVAAVAKMRGWRALPARLAFANDIFNYICNTDKTSAVYKEHKKLIHTIHTLHNTITKATAEDLIKNEAFVNLSVEDGELLKSIVGAVLFDPTILYRNANT